MSRTVLSEINESLFQSNSWEKIYINYFYWSFWIFMLMKGENMPSFPDSVKNRRRIWWQPVLHPSWGWGWGAGGRDQKSFYQTDTVPPSGCLHREYKKRCPCWSFLHQEVWIHAKTEDKIFCFSNNVKCYKAAVRKMWITYCKMIIYQSTVCHCVEKILFLWSLIFSFSDLEI